ncbi:MAG: hypothetical protein ACREMH_10115 [Gemmatimonadales bacterium]
MQCSSQCPSLFLAAGIALTTVACGSDSSGPETVPLECEVQDYPCSLSDVPIAILERADALGDEALTMLEAGSTVGDAAAWLEGQGDMAEVEWDDGAIWYRLEGGVGFWLLWEDAFGVGAGAGGHRRGTAAPPEFHIVGPDTEEKKALVLSPFHWELEDEDEGPVVEAILAGVRGYEGRVTFQSNAERTSTDVSLGSYLSWGAYQVIHVSTHGTRVCDDAGCRAMFAAGLLETGLPPGPETKAEKLKALKTHGVTYAKSRHGDEYMVLGADFFRQRYPQGLKDALVFINTCKSFGPQATDLADAIRGSSSMVLGWTEGVLHPDAVAAAAALYEALAKGYPATVALQEIGDLAAGDPVDVGSGIPELQVTGRGAGGDLRIRDVVELLEPESGAPLSAASRVAILGTQGDGEPDAVAFLVRVDGVKQQFAEEMTVRVAVDGEEGDPVDLADGEKDDQDRWLVRGVVPLGHDVEEETPATFRATVSLHSGGESMQEVGATLAGEEPIMGRVWQMQAVQTFGWVPGIPHTPWSATTLLTLEFAPGQPAGEPNPRYRITGGTVTFDYNHSYYDCTYSAPVLTFDVTAEVAGESRLLFDTTQNPVLYYGVLATQGPEFEVVEGCGGGDPSTRTHRAVNSWLVLDPDEARTVSTDRRTITGTYRVTGAGGDFVVESIYTITRVE